jgi:hypothetical protein
MTVYYVDCVMLSEIKLYFMELRVFIEEAMQLFFRSVTMISHTFCYFFSSFVLLSLPSPSFHISSTCSLPALYGTASAC